MNIPHNVLKAITAIENNDIENLEKDFVFIDSYAKYYNDAVKRITDPCVLWFLYDNIPKESLYKIFDGTVYITQKAIKEGNIDILIFAIEMGFLSALSKAYDITTIEDIEAAKLIHKSGVFRDRSIPFTSIKYLIDNVPRFIEVFNIDPKFIIKACELNLLEAIIEADHKNSIECIKIVLPYFINDASVINKCKMLSISFNKLEILKLLTEANQDIVLKIRRYYHTSNNKLYVKDFHREACVKDTEILKYLFRTADITVNCKSKLIGTYMYGNEKDHELLRILANKGVSMERLFYNRTYKNDIKDIKLLIELGVNLKEKIEGKSLLFTCKDLESFRYLVNKGLDINEKDAVGNAAYVYLYSPDCIQYFIENNLDLYYKNPDGTSLLSNAIKHSNIESIRILLNHAIQNNDLHKADKSIQSLYLNCKYKFPKQLGDMSTTDMTNDLNALDINGETLLFKEIKKGDLDAIKSLIERGADPHIVNKYGDSILKTVCILGYIDILKYLMSINVNINTINSRGETLLFTSIRFRNHDITELLIDSGIDIHCVSKKKENVLTVALNKDISRTIELLYDKGVRGVTDDDSDLYRYAIHKSSIEFLLSKAIYPKTIEDLISNNDNNSMYDQILNYNSFTILKYVIENFPNNKSQLLDKYVSNKCNIQRDDISYIPKTMNNELAELYITSVHEYTKELVIKHKDVNALLELGGENVQDIADILADFYDVESIDDVSNEIIYNLFEKDMARDLVSLKSN